MPLGKDVGSNMKEMMADNTKKGKAKGANGKPRSRAQMVAISLNAARKAGADVPLPKDKAIERLKQRSKNK